MLVDSWNVGFATCGRAVQLVVAIGSILNPPRAGVSAWQSTQPDWEIRRSRRRSTLCLAPVLIRYHGVPVEALVHADLLVADASPTSSDTQCIIPR